MAISNNFVAGAYSLTFDTLALGFTEAGFEVITRPSFNPIRVDEFGRTPIDAIWTGLEDLIIRFEGLEWTKALYLKMAGWLHGSTTPAITQQGKVEKAGTLLVSGAGAANSAKGAQPLIITSLTNTPSAAYQTYTYARAYPLEPVRHLFSSQQLRRTPLGFYCFADPTNSASQVAQMYGFSDT